VRSGHERVEIIDEVARRGLMNELWSLSRLSTRAPSVRTSGSKSVSSGSAGAAVPTAASGGSDLVLFGLTKPGSRDSTAFHIKAMISSSRPRRRKAFLN
jgi:hypothetical protein